MDYATQRKLRHVILIGRWAMNVEGNPIKGIGAKVTFISDASLKSSGPADSRIVFSNGLSRTVTHLLEAGIQVWLLKQVPLLPGRAPELLARTALVRGSPDSMGVPLVEHRARQANVDKVLGELAAHAKVNILDPADILCSTDGLCRMSSGGYALYTDHNHLSTHGARYLRPLFEPLFRQIAEGR